MNFSSSDHFYFRTIKQQTDFSEYYYNSGGVQKHVNNLFVMDAVFLGDVLMGKCTVSKRSYVFCFQGTPVILSRNTTNA